LDRSAFNICCSASIVRFSKYNWYYTKVALREGGFLG
jgi:hypothetical protein